MRWPACTKVNSMKVIVGQIAASVNILAYRDYSHRSRFIVLLAVDHDSLT